MSASPGAPRVVDAVLAELLQHVRDPVEPFAENQGMALFGWLTANEALTAQHLKTGKRLVTLACGHLTFTKAMHRAKCPRCGAMIRAGFDHQAFRRGEVPDTLVWPGDPLLALHEA